MKFLPLFFLLFVASAVFAVPIAKSDSRAESDDAHEDQPELVTVNSETPEESFVRSDANGDDSLTFDEFLHSDLAYEQLKKKDFELLDINGDGKVTHQEYSNYYDKTEQEAAAGQQAYYGGVFKEFDANMDKRLNKNEIAHLLKARFRLQPKENFDQLYARFDADGDGALDREEYQKFDQTFPFYELEPAPMA